MPSSYICKICGYHIDKYGINKDTLPDNGKLPCTYHKQIGISIPKKKCLIM